jgi:hypothetical protein
MTETYISFLDKLVEREKKVMIPPLESVATSLQKREDGEML